MSYDIKNGILMQKKKFIPFILFASYIVIYVLVNSDNSKPTFGNFILLVFQGDKQFSMNNSNGVFQIPVLWLIFHMYISYLVGYYPFEELSGIGKLCIIKSKSRVKWWSHKCVWNVLTVVTCYGVLYASIAIGTAFVGKYTLTPNMRIAYKLSDVIDNGVVINGKEVLIWCVVMPMIVSIGVSLLQMAAALFYNQYIAIL